MKNVLTTTYMVSGIAVDRYSPKVQSDHPPIILVHGGEHGSWCWENWAHYLAQAGYDVHALNWFSHGDSTKLSDGELAKRSLREVASQELTIVADYLPRKPLVIGHSMGGMVAALFAALSPVVGLGLVAPVLPKSAGADPIPLPVDLAQPFPVFSYEQAKQLFFTTMPPVLARELTKLLVPESAQAVIEATQWTIDLDPKSIAAPKLVIGAEQDNLIPNKPLKRYAQQLGAEYDEWNVGHSDLLLKPGAWRAPAKLVLEWCGSVER